MRRLLALLAIGSMIGSASAQTRGPAISPERHDAAKAMLERLVNTPTVLGRGQVPAMATYLAEQYKAAGFPAADVQVLPYQTVRAVDKTTDETAALMVRWRVPGAKAKPVMLLGHMDVVEAKLEDSTADPFKLVERDGYYYGRGTLDMKGGLTDITQALIELRKQGFKPTREIVVFFTGDEETNGIGATKGATEWRQLMGDPEFGLNADGGGIDFTSEGTPRLATIQTAEKTYADYTFTVRNRGGHSSKPRTDNAIYQLSHALERLQAHRFQPMLNETTRAYFAARAKVAEPELAAAMTKWLADPDDAAAADAVEASESEVGLTRTRCVATRLFGGHADNALPQLATANVNCRIFPGVTPDQVLAELTKVAGDPELVVTRNDRYVASLASPLRPDITAAFTKAVTTLHPGMPVAPEMSTGASDARPFRVAGIPVYGVDGIWIRSPEDLRAHGKDERIPVAALDDGIRHWIMLVGELAGK